MLTSQVVYEFSPEGTPARTPPTSHRGASPRQTAAGTTSPSKVGSYAPPQARSSRFAQHYEPPTPSSPTAAAKRPHSRQEAAATPTRDLEQVRSPDAGEGGRHHHHVDHREHSPPTTTWQSKLASLKNTFLGKCFRLILYFCSLSLSLSILMLYVWFYVLMFYAPPTCKVVYSYRANLYSNSIHALPLRIRLLMLVYSILWLDPILGTPRFHRRNRSSPRHENQAAPEAPVSSPDTKAMSLKEAVHLVRRSSLRSPNSAAIQPEMMEPSRPSPERIAGVTLPAEVGGGIPRRSWIGIDVLVDTST